MVDLTKPGVQSLEGKPGGRENLALSGLGRSLIISIGGMLQGFCFDKGSLASFNKKSRPYCFLPSVLIGDHCSAKSKKKKLSRVLTSFFLNTSSSPLLISCQGHQAIVANNDKFKSSKSFMIQLSSSYLIPPRLQKVCVKIFKRGKIACFVCFTRQLLQYSV